MKTPKEIIDELSFVCIDLETTGGNQNTDKIIELGLVKIENKVITKELHYLINPEIPIPQFIQNLTSISPETINESPRIEEVIDEIINFLGDSIVVAHNVSFDVPFLNSVLKRLGKPEIKNRSLCTNLMTKYVIPNILSSNLNYMSQIFSIPHQAHRALEDAKACAHLLIKYLDIFEEKGIKKVNQLYYPRNKFELDRTHVEASEFPKLLEKLKKLHVSGFLTYKGENGVLLASVALNCPADEYAIAETIFNKVDCNIVTLQLVGSLFEGILLHNLHFNKYSEEIQKLTVNYYCEYHLGKTPEELANVDKFKDLFTKYFLITKHLVPGQLVISPLFNIHYKNELIFRYPGHKKRVMHYCNGQIKRLSSNKKSPFKTMFHADMFPFVCHFLNKMKERPHLGYLFVDKDVVQNEKGKIFNLIHNFLIQNEETYNYPKEHI